MRIVAITIVLAACSARKPPPPPALDAAPVRVRVPVSPDAAPVPAPDAAPAVLGNLDGKHGFCNTPKKGICTETVPERVADEKPYCRGTWSMTSGCPGEGVLGVCTNELVPKAGRTWLYSAHFPTIEAANAEGVCWDKGDVFTP